MTRRSGSPNGMDKETEGPYPLLGLLLDGGRILDIECQLDYFLSSSQRSATYLVRCSLSLSLSPATYIFETSHPALQHLILATISAAPTYRSTLTPLLLFRYKQHLKAHFQFAVILPGDRIRDLLQYETMFDNMIHILHHTERSPSETSLNLTDRETELENGRPTCQSS